MIRIGYLVKNEEFKKKIWNLMSYDSEILVYELASDDENEIRSLKIELMIFDFYGKIPAKLDHFETVKENLKVRGICVLGEYTDELVECVLRHQISYMCDLEIGEVGLYVLLLRIMNENHQLSVPLHDRIENICKSRHLSTHLKGYDYVRTAILYYIENESNVYRMKDVYDVIAKKYHTTGSRVEKNMRLAINASGSSLSNARFVYDCYEECIHG